jgi:Adenylate and Guanylate cyclase catalytic domain
VADGKLITDMYLGLHVGEVFYGNVGSRERLDFTVIGPAVNEASRIAAMCRSVDQPVLVSSAFANVGGIKRRLGRTIRATRRRTFSGVIYARSRCISSGIQNLTRSSLVDIRSGFKTGEAREYRSLMWWTRFGVIYRSFESERDPLRLHKDWWNYQSCWLWSRTSQKAVL